MMVFINQDSGYLMIDIINGFRRAGHDCALVSGRLVERNTGLDPQVRWHRIARYRRNSNMGRLSTWLLAMVQTFFLVAFRYRKSHLFIVTSPPFAPLLPLFLRNDFSLLIFDMYPDAFVEHGIFSRRSFFNRTWSRLNRKVYPRAQKIYTLSPGMKERLSSYCPEEKIELASLWSDNKHMKPLPKQENPFVKEHGLEDKFVVLYSGNFGKFHRVDFLVDLAAAVEDERIFFLIIGSGSEEATIRKRLQQHPRDNCRLLPWQDPAMLPYSMACADLAVVTLGDHSKSLALPSKLFNFMSVGVPVLAVADPGSSLGRMVEDYGIGGAFHFDEKAAMVDFITRLERDRESHRILGANALKASLKHTVENVNIFLHEDMQPSK